MRRVTYILTSLILTIILTSYGFAQVAEKLYDIPAQTINLLGIMGDSASGKTQNIQACQISELVTFKAYKAYLDVIKRDSSEAYYQSQLPDSNIAPPEVRDKYINRSEYDDFPVLGISWDNAMNFCRWKTLEENKDSIQFIYRLPNCSEWLAAYSYLLENNSKHDFNDKYSDWLINSKDETFYGLKNGAKEIFPFNHIYFHQQKDPPVLKRKFVIGDSYLYQQDKLINYYNFSYYATKGYRQVAFRFVKEPVRQIETAYPKKKTLPANILAYWGLNTK